jgi:SNF2 family DNA or RNA helicase
MATGERGSGARKFEATPEFVAGGPLHPYQLEGLNWLYHKAQVRHAWAFRQLHV